MSTLSVIGSVHRAAHLFGGSSSGASLQRPSSVLSFTSPTPASLLASNSFYSPSTISGYAASDISSVFSDVRLADDPVSNGSERSSVSSRCEVDTTTDCAPVAARGTSSCMWSCQFPISKTVGNILILVSRIRHILRAKY